MGLFHNFKDFIDYIKTFFEQLSLPCRCKFNPKRSPLRKHAPISSLYLLDYDHRIAELGLDHEPPVFRISGQRLTFKKGRWISQSCQGIFPSSQSDLVKNVKERNRLLQDQNNVLQLKLELVMDMLTETTANLLLLEEDEDETEEREQQEEEEEKEEEKKTCPKKLPTRSNKYEVDSSDFELEEEVTPSQRGNRYEMEPTSTEDESGYSELKSRVFTKKPQGEVKPKVCPMRRAALAASRARASSNKYPNPKAQLLFPSAPVSKTKSSPKVCKLELEPKPKPKRRRAESRPKPVKPTNGTCPVKKGSRL
ncbi:histone H3.v1-like [Heptranchias perlo]|uniref:histone H3.v1-like n=1 Tax=Heptranchias perlo TaxID=212740 RepID=UPI0035595ABB